MQNVSKIVKIIAFVAFVYGGQLFGGGFDIWKYAEWLDELKKSTQHPLKTMPKAN